MTVAVTVSKDTEFLTSASPDINAYDALRQTVRKSSQELDIQVFYLRSILGKLNIALSDVPRLKQESDPESQGNEEKAEIRSPHIVALELESTRLKIASAWLQAREARLRCDETIRKIQEVQKGVARVRATLIFPEEVLNQNIEALQKRIDDLKRQLAVVKKDFDNASTSLTQARAALAPESADIDTLTPANSRYMERVANLNYWE